MTSYELKQLVHCDDKQYTKEQSARFLVQMGVRSHIINQYIKELEIYANNNT